MGFFKTFSGVNMVKKKFWAAMLTMSIVTILVFALGGTVSAYSSYDEIPPATFGVTPREQTITHSGVSPFEFEFYNLTFGYADDHMLAYNLELTFDQTGKLTDRNGHSIDFTVTAKDGNTTGQKVKRSWISDDAVYDPFTLNVDIKTSDYRNLAPGTYTGYINYQSMWDDAIDLANDYYTRDVAGPSATIAIKLTITDPKAEYGYFDDGFKWELSNTGKLTVSGTGDMPDFKVYDTPWQYVEREVKTIEIKQGITAIGDYAFMGCFNNTSVSIPSGVTRIGERAFASQKITSAVIPDGVTFIGEAAFHNCTEMTSVTIPDSVSSMGTHVFTYCSSLKTIKLPANIKRIENYTLAYCYDLESVYIPEGVTSIGRCAFECTNLTSIIIPESVTSIDDYAFNDYGYLQSITINKVAYSEDAFPGYSLAVFHYYYGVNYTNDGHGKVTGPKSAYAGSNLELTITPNSGYEIDKVTMDYAGKIVNVNPVNGKYVYERMPDVDGTVIIKATFKAVASQNTLRIISHPHDYTGDIGTYASFALGATGDGIKYQWQYFNGSAWKNATADGNTSSIMSIKITEARDGQKYRCVVTDKFNNELISDEAVLRVTPGPITITKQPANYTGAIGKTAKLTVTATGADLTYQWQYNNGSGWKKSTATGAATSTLKIKITEARNGQRYRCLITDKYGNKIYSKTATLFVARITITTQPATYTGAVGKTAKFTVEASGNNLTYQWQYSKDGVTWKNSTSSGATTSTMKIKVTSARNGQQYRCVIKDSDGNTVTTKTVMIKVK